MNEKKQRTIIIVLSVAVVLLVLAMAGTIMYFVNSGKQDKTEAGLENVETEIEEDPTTDIDNSNEIEAEEEEPQGENMAESIDETENISNSVIISEAAECEELLNQVMSGKKGFYENKNQDGYVFISGMDTGAGDGSIDYLIGGTQFYGVFNSRSCTKVVNDNEFYFEYPEVCVALIFTDDGIQIHDGETFENCTNLSLELGERVDVTPIEPYKFAGAYKQLNGNNEISISIYSDYFEMYDEIGNMRFSNQGINNQIKASGLECGYIYWQGDNFLAMCTDQI